MMDDFLQRANLRIAERERKATLLLNASADRLWGNNERVQEDAYSIRSDMAYLKEALDRIVELEDALAYSRGAGNLVLTDKEKAALDHAVRLMTEATGNDG